MNHFVIQEIAPDASVGRAISTSVPWTLSDMLGLEHSAAYSLEVQNFISWLVGGIVHRLREKQPETFDGDTLLQRMLQSLTTAVEHLAVETLGQRALAVVRRREHLFTYLPKRYSNEDKSALRSTSLSGSDLVDDHLLRQTDDRSTSRSTKAAFERIASQGSGAGNSSRRPRVQPRQQQQQQKAPRKSQERQHDSSSSRQPTSSTTNTFKRNPSPPRRQEDRPVQRRDDRPANSSSRGRYRKRGRRGDFRR
mgnify:CR=1 FL=1